MDLLEYEGKKLFGKHGITVPKGSVASSLKEIRKSSSIADQLVLKAQIPSGKRGKSGGIVFATEKDLLDKARKMFSKETQGFKVRHILVEERLDAEREMYLSLTVSREDKSIIVLFSEKGGIDVEELTQRHKDEMIKKQMTEFQKNKKTVLFRQRTDQNKLIEKQINTMIKQLYKLMLQNDATLVEINPLAVVKDKVIALDSKIVIDDNALYRHKEFNKAAASETALLSKAEQRARELGIQYVELKGNIGVVGNGAGLVMATLDMISYHGGRPANFLDIGGGADTERMISALDICLMNKKVKGLLINIFGGITRCDEMACGLIDYKHRKKISMPVVVRMIGTNEPKARSMLAHNKIEMHDTMELCSKRMIELAKKARGGVKR
ncbi:MAG: acetate--CoA ligase family protein [Nanoarchaeota archaeon]|nr:acetate--CoA ligase family protein [Nanoarchaeota archaeon]